MGGSGGGVEIEGNMGLGIGERGEGDKIGELRGEFKEEKVLS